MWLPDIYDSKKQFLYTYIEIETVLQYVYNYCKTIINNLKNLKEDIV